MIAIAAAFAGGMLFLPTQNLAGYFANAAGMAPSALQKDADGKKADTPKVGGAPDRDAAEGGEKTETPELEYVRIRRNDRNLAQALETSVVKMDGSSKYPKATVDLIGAIHLGEPEYYSQLNKLFKTYDAVLYEAVMPEDAVERDLRPGGGGGERASLSDEAEWTEAKVGLAAISVLQIAMKDALGLEFQLGGVDYSPRNFVHADMTSEEFEESMAKRGESFSQMMAREMSKAVMEPNQQNPLAMNLDMMISSLASDRLYRVRRIAAVQLSKAGVGDAFAGHDGTSTIITERNIKALEVLRKQLDKKVLKIAVFYGAGHLADMEKRMIADFGFRRSGEDWLIAWQLRPPAKKP